jgi:hypothetical protein
LLHVVAPDLATLHSLLVDRFSKRKEVVGFRTSVVYDFVRQAAPMPLPSEDD